MTTSNAAAPPSPPSPPPPDGVVEYVEGWLEDPRTYSPGLAIAAFDRSGIIWSGGFGMADPDSGTPATATTLYHFASVTKVHTSLLLALLADEGLLGIDDPVVRHIPEFRPRYAEPGSRPVTLRDLATHTSGLTNTWGGLGHSLGERELLEGLQSCAMAIQPGHQYKYSNYGTSLLGLALTRVAGMSFEELVRRRIFQPLGMSSSGFCALYDHPCLAPGYDIIDGQPHRLPPSPPFKAHAPASAIVSTVGDMARFGSAHLAAGERSLIPPQVQDILFCAHSPTTGLGWHYHGGRVPRWWHLGSWHGHYTRLVIRPEIGVGFAVATNGFWGGVDLVEPLVQLLAPDADTSCLEHLCGVYTGKAGSVEVTLPNDPSLTLAIDGQKRLIPISRHNFRVYENDQPTAAWARFVTEEDNLLLLLERECYIRRPALA